jgi:hypothetical protein
MLPTANTRPYLSGVSVTKKKVLDVLNNIEHFFLRKKYARAFVFGKTLQTSILQEPTLGLEVLP